MCFKALKTRALNPSFFSEKSPATQTILKFVSTSTAPNFCKSSTISFINWLLSIVSETATSEVVIMSIGVL